MDKRQRPDPSLVALARLDLLRSCSPAQLEALLPHTDVIDVPAGTVVSRSGGFPHQLLGVLDGFVAAVDERGCSTVLTSREQCGASELLEETGQTVTLTAVTDSSLVIVFGPAFAAFVRSLPADAADVIRSTALSQPMPCGPLAHAAC